MDREKDINDWKEMFLRENWTIESLTELKGKLEQLVHDGKVSESNPTSLAGVNEALTLLQNQQQA